VQREGHTADDPARAAVTNGPGCRDVLELSLSDTRQLFNSMDPAPFRDYFQRRAAATRRQLQQLLRLGRYSLLIALVFLAVVVVIGESLASLVSRERYAALIEHSLVIGAWVALWRPLEIFLYDWWPVRAEARLYDRLGVMDVRVVATSVAASPGDGGAP